MSATASGAARGWALLAAGCAAAACAAGFIPAIPAVATTASAGVAVVAALLAAVAANRQQRQAHALQLQIEERVLENNRLQVAARDHSTLQDALLQAKQAAEAATLAKGEFLATMSHEIRTPLNGILPMLELVAQGPLSLDQRNMLDTATDSSRQLFRIVDDILDYSKLEANRLELEITTFNLRETLDGMLRLMQRAAEHKGLRLSLHIDPAVRLSVRGDPVRLRQVLGNLLVNAIKFTELGEISIHVKRLGETAAQHRLRFEVRDTGIGLDTNQQQRLFNAFTQADASTTRLYGGTGLGLAICKRIVDLMHGSIGVHSEPLRGSTFWFEIPLLKVIGDLHQPDHLRKVRQVLLVTPEQRLRQRLQLILPNWGYQPVAANNLQEALERLRMPTVSGIFHAVIGDLEPLRNSAPALQRAIERMDDNRPRLLWLYGDAPIAEGLRDGATLLPRQLPDTQLRNALSEPLQFAPSPAPTLLPGDAGAAAMAPVATASNSTAATIAPAGFPAGAQTKPMPVPAAATNNANAGADLAGMLVLLVEDNSVNLMVAQKLLKVLGASTEAAENGAIALDKMHAKRYDAVLMDCQMPVLDGFAATGRWREHEASSGASNRLPIIAMTANAMAGDRQRCLDAGMDEYLSKPISRTQLLNCLLAFKPASSATTEPVTSMPSTDLSANALAAASTAHTDGITASILERSVLDELLEIAGDEINAIIDVFLDETPQLVRHLQEAAVMPDLKRLGELAHSLKSSSANVGVLALSEAARRLEHGARSGTLERPTVMVALIVAEFSRARMALAGYQAEQRKQAQE
ncbi:ATP-binding protein [uncultured Stenotrophomonas sp.]|uniref:ATP-binding protein n=1 Tax=uncultured Stenotrophomonas sp. TaxID=165438 RepID=UPI0025DF0018|nr:ATP-binding protein [uncultured Stenotrophomonas sp.]